MKAARIYGIKDVRIEDIPIGDPKPGEVQVQVKYTGICGSDIHSYHRGWALPTIPHPVTGQVLPVVLGHESTGEIVKLGSGVSNLKVGDRVAIEPLISCGRCEACAKGLYNCCENAVGSDGSGNVIGFGADGGFAEYVNVKANTAFLLPEGLDYQLGALVEPAAVAVQAVYKSEIKAGQTAVIFGAGPIGLLIAITAMAAGVSELFVVDISKERLERAKELGVKYVINSSEESAVEKIRSITGNGVDLAFDAAGVQATLDAATDCVKNTGRIQIVAVFNDPPKVRLSNLLMKGVDIYTTLCYANVYPQTLRLIAANPQQYRKIISNIVPLENLVEEGLELLETDKSQAKVLVCSDIHRGK